MFKIGLENRDFCKSLHFYIVDAGKKKKKKKKKKKTSCICWLVQLLSALRVEGIALRAMPSLFVFLVLRGACQCPDHQIIVLIINKLIIIKSIIQACPRKINIAIHNSYINLLCETGLITGFNFDVNSNRWNYMHISLSDLLLLIL